MRILNLRFKNLNSLMGEWSIDFTHPAYTSDSIFAITGPTGSGKSTILDAICLALYGRTPRLNRVGKAANEIMSRQTGECFAEVVFENQAGRFRCHWSQHRARKKPDGELQNPKHEIVDTDTGDILDTKLRDVAQTVENVTGMDFDRFTRSMLLAQGGFAAFLQAPPDERAPILEQITGTEIYSQISIKVHERRSEERKKLDALQAKLTGMNLLSEEEEQQLHSDLQEKQRLENELSDRLIFLGKALDGLERIAGLKKDIASLDEQRRDFEKQWQEFQPDLQRLTMARKALAIEGDYIRICTIRKQQDQDNQELNEVRLNLPAREEAQNQAFNTLEDANNKLETARTAQQHEAETIKKVRELDTRIADHNKLISKLREDIASIKVQYQNSQEQILQNQDSLKQSQVALKKVQDYLTEHAIDAGLIANLKAIDKLFDRVYQCHAHHEKLQERLEVATKKRDELAKTCLKLDLAYDDLHLEFTRAEQVHQQIIEEITALLQGREPGDWREKLEALKGRKRLLETTEQSLKHITMTQQTLIRLKTKRESLITEQSRLLKEIQFCIEQQTISERELKHLETEVALLNRIRDLEEERLRLEDNKPCPLCGSIEHPFAQGNIPVMDQAESALKHAKNELKKIADHLKNLQITEAAMAKDIEQVQNEVMGQQALLETEEKQSLQSFSDLGIDAIPDMRLDQIQRELTAIQTVIDQSSTIINEFEQKEKKEKTSRLALDRARTALVNYEKDRQQALHKRDMAEQEYNRLVKECQASTEQLANARRESLQEVMVYGIEELPDTALNHILDSLVQRRDNWQSKQVEKESHEKNIIHLKTELEKQQVLLKKLDEDWRKKRKEYDELAQQLQVLTRERQDLYGEKNPDDEEQRLAEAILSLGKALEQARTAYGLAQQEISNLQARINFLITSTEKRAQELIAVELDFKARLIQLGFLNEEAYRTSCLPEEERNLLAEREQSLRQKQTEIDTRYLDKTAALNKEQSETITEQPKEILREEHAECQSRLKAIQQEIGVISQRLVDNDLLRNRQQEHLTKIERQRKENERWDVLHELIGSADGKKFRNFAQGLTFEIMAANANRQLQRMTDRYLLFRDKTQPLELNVIDNWQGGQIRSTKNLSGGECFMVSLALALGLSQMASKVRIDSLFLDEGFGTLDEEALDAALETLAGLRQDGKTIGVISHVPALKERISAQIQVIPLNGGRSSIKGPGCRSIQ